MRILEEFRPFLRLLLKAFAFEHFRQNNWLGILRSVSYAFGVILCILAIPTFILLVIWYFCENDVDLKQIADPLPILQTSLPLEIAFIVMLMKIRLISQTIDQIESIVGRRECFPRYIYLMIFP